MLYEDVDTKELDKFINERFDCISAYTLDYYLHHDEKCEMLDLFEKDIYEYKRVKLSDLRDDIVIITQVSDNEYIYFWYHMSGRCDMCRFVTEDSKTEILSELVDWCKDLKRQELITGYSSLDHTELHKHKLEF